MTRCTRIAPRVQTERLRNGIRVYLLPNHANTTLEIIGLLEGGLGLEPAARSGLADLTFDMLDRGTRTRDEQAIAESLEDNGALLRYDLARETVLVRARSLSEDEELIITLLGETLGAPSFPEDALRRAREETVISLREIAFDTFEQAYRRAAGLLLGPTHPDAREPEGEEAVVETLAREELVDHHARTVTAERLSLVVAGDIDPARTLAWLDRHLGGLPAGGIAGTRDAAHAIEAPGDAASRAALSLGAQDAAAPVPGAMGLVRDRVPIPDKTQVDVVLLRPGIARTDPEFEACAMANFLFGGSFVSRVNQRLRDREGLTYGAESAISSGLRPGCWYTAWGVDAGDLERSIGIVREELRRFVDEGAGADEWSQAQAHLTGSFPIRLETNQSVAAALLDGLRHGWGLDYVDRYTERVLAMTREQVTDAARRLLDPDNLVIVAAGTFD
jgi:zinc protease